MTSRLSRALPLLFSLFALACTNARAQDKNPVPPKGDSPTKVLRKDRNIYAGIGLGGPASSHPAMNVHCNALINESSPYLLQHAWNPVNWRPWSEEAFALAKKEDKPIFLSVGYSTCHWCHVMEKESFESEETAKILNENYICIKLDREERPDLDEFYMAAVVELNRGHGGWPMSLFLTADKKAFIGATYFRPEQFRNALRKILGYWKNDRKALVEQAEQLTKSIKESKSVISKEGRLDLKLCDETVTRSWSFFDQEHGGFGQRGPKFPRGMTALFFLRNYQRTKSEKALTMVKKTLTEMYEGGMYDQVGGGFHRYSVDRIWLVPHFEKMLYDNGILARVYAEAFRQTGDKEYRRIAVEIAEYFMRDMILSHGGIASAEDADSAGEEGLFYLWTPKEIQSVLSADEAKLVIEHYGVTEAGNFAELPKHTILNIAKPLKEVAKAHKWTMKDAEALRESAKAKLLAYRAKRIRPLRDDKVITAWNGLGISGLANVARLTGDKKILKAAQGAAAFILEKLRRKDGRLLRRYRSGQAAFLAILDDYAYLTDGLLELYMADGQSRWLKAALDLEAETRRLFWDKTNGGFYKTASDVKDLVARSRDVSDGARPAGASIAAMNMIRVAELKRDDDLRKQARKVMALEVKNAERSPLAYVSLLSVLEQYQASPQEIIVVGPDSKESQAMLAEIHKQYLPNAVLVSLVGKDADAVRQLLPKMTEGRVSAKGQATVYLCKDRVCLAPITKVEDLKKALQSKKK